MRNLLLLLLLLLSRTGSKINNISVKNRRFSHPMYLTPPLREFPLELCNGGSAEITSVMPLSDGGTSLTICAIILDTISEYDRQTGTQVDGRIC